MSDEPEEICTLEVTYRELEMIVFALRDQAFSTNSEIPEQAWDDLADHLEL